MTILYGSYVKVIGAKYTFNRCRALLWAIQGRPRYENINRLHFMPSKASLWFEVQ